MKAIAIDNALLCVNCDFIFELPENHCNVLCPVCASNTYIRLSSVLNRTEEKK